MSYSDAKSSFQYSKTGGPLPRPARWAKREHRIFQIHRFLIENGGWVSTDELNKQFRMPKRTLRSTLNSMVTEGLIRSAISLNDSRTRLYKAQ